MTRDLDNPRPPGMPALGWPSNLPITPCDVSIGTGKLPWRVDESRFVGGLTFAVKDASGVALFAASPGICRQIVAAVNVYPTLLGELVEKTDVLRALFAQIVVMPKSQARTRALNLIEDTLHKERSAS